MAGQVLNLLAPQKGQVYLDLTAGYGGHARLVAEFVRPTRPKNFVLVDRDSSAAAALKKHFGSSVRVMRTDFLAAAKQLVAEGFKADMILLDLGVSSPQLDEPTRGFSFRNPGPLDMRMDRRQALTAGQIVNNTPQNQLADLIYNFGQEPRSRGIAAAIVKNRPIADTEQLARVVLSCFRRYQIPHPAQKVFQAIRIAVNSELTQLEETVKLLPELLRPGGRAVVISFHSLEDKMVKNFIRDLCKKTEQGKPEFTNLTKHPLKGSQFDAANQRARSAKLRAFAKNKTTASA